MTNILTAAEAADVLRCAVDDARLLDLLPQIDAYIKTATGHAWEGDTPIHETAKAAARMLLVQWFEDPGMLVGGQALSFGVQACLTQLQALALRYRKFMGRNGAGSIEMSGVAMGDKVETLIGLTGVSGDQSTDFESVISVNDQIQQTSTDDLSENWYLVCIAPMEEK